MIEQKRFSRLSSAVLKPVWGEGVPSDVTVPPRSLYAVRARAAEEPLVVRGFAEVAAYKPMLIELAKATGQAGAMDDVDYFLSAPGALKRIPYLILRRGSATKAGTRGFSGATLVFESRIRVGWATFGGAGVFATLDATGRRAVLASVETRASVAAEAMRTLLRRGAHVVHVVFQQGMEDSCADVVRGELVGGLVGTMWSLREQPMEMYLPLEETFDLTLARIGQRTRSNLRYYRRRTERDLGCMYVAEAEVGEDEFLAMNRACKYAVPDEMARWRYRSLKVVADPLFCGIKDRDGLWLSLVGGRRRKGEVEIDWQINRDGLALYSLSTVMRACLIEQEVARGTRRLYIEGGTPHPMRLSFAKERVAELVVKRGSVYVGLLERFAEQLFPPKNYLSQVLRDAKREWHAV